MIDLTPHQQKFLEYYLDPQSETWGNALQSAIKAGYSEEYSKVMISRDLTWLSENVNDNELVRLALDNLKVALGGGLDIPDGAKNIQYKATETTLKSLLNKKFGDKKQVDITTKGEKIVLDDEKRKLALQYEEELKNKM